jgi:uncharacterized protein (TIGR03437 family)
MGKGWNMRHTLWLLVLPLCASAQQSYLAYSSYLGGNGVDVIHAMATDGQGNVFVTGETTSSDFPVTAGAVQTKHAGIPGTFFGLIGPLAHPDAFVAKINAAGKLVWATYLGGGNADFGLAIAVDATRNVYVLGGTFSTDFPTTPGTYQKTSDGSGAAFIAKLSPDGSTLLYSTYVNGVVPVSSYVPLQGLTSEFLASPGALALDPSGNVYFGGTSTSPSLKSTTGAYKNTGEAFVAKLNPAGSALAFLTYLGGTGTAITRRIALDPSGNVYAAGSTEAPDFPTTSGALETTIGSDSIGGFVVKLDPAGTHAIYAATFGGGNGGTKLSAFVVDSEGNGYVGGLTSAADVLPSASVEEEGYVAKLNATGSKLIYATGFGSGTEVHDLRIDASDRVLVAGGISVTGLPITADALPKRFAGSTCLFSNSPFNNPSFTGICGDAFAARLTAAGAIDYATYISGSGPDTAAAIVGKPDGGMWVAGVTQSNDFPVAGTSISDLRSQTTCEQADSPSSEHVFNCDDGFLSEIAFGTPPPAPALFIVNTGSLIDAPIAPASVVTLFGTGLGPETPVSLEIQDGKVSTTLAGEQVLFNGVAAPLLSVSATQITAIVPNAVKQGTHVTVAVAKSGQTLASTTVPVVSAEPALLTFDPSGSGQAAALNPDGTVNSPTNPAPAGTYIALFAVGLGATSDGDGAIAKTAASRNDIEATFGPSLDPVPTVLYAGPSPGSISALTQINVKLPIGLTGNNVPVWVLAGGSTSQTGMTVAIR